MTMTERVPLSRPRIAEAALGYIDEHGLEALSMRKLGAVLGVEAMSLYNHVASKDDLLAAVMDSIYSEVLESYGAPSGGWRAKARTMAHAYRDATDRHPNALPLLIERPVESEVGLEFMSRIVSIFDDLTDDLGEAALAFHVAASWLIGTIIQEHGIMRRLAEGEDMSADAVPAWFEPIVRFKEACVDSSTSEERFREGLGVMLDGLERRFHQG
ncbi:MAG: TetR/AcrR family transcriptional regulator [Acidimicrobiales bacterium]